MKFISYIFSLLIIFNNSEAQIIKGYGAKAGITSSYQTIYGLEGNSYTNNKLGVRLGVFCDFLNFKYLFLRTELSYVTKGAEFTDVHTDTSSKTMSILTSMNYLTFSPTVNLKTNFKYVNFNFLLGPKIDYLINYNENILNHIYEGINRVSFGLILGLGSEIYISKHLSLLSEFRYDFDISKFTVSGYSIGKLNHVYADGGSFANKDIELLIGVRIRR